MPGPEPRPVMNRGQSGRAWAGAIAALMLLAVAVQVPWTQSAAVLPRRLALHALAVVVLLHASRRFRLGQVGAVACALGLWQALTWSVSETRWLGIPRLMDGVAALVLLVAVAGGRLPRRALLWPLVVAGGLGAALGLLQQWVELPWLVQATRPSGFFVSRAVAGEYVAASLLLTVGFMTRRERPLTLVLVGLQVAFLVSTRSRTGWAVAVLGLIWVGSWLARKEQRAVGATVALAVTLALLLTPGPRIDWHAPRPYAGSLISLSRLELGGRLVTWRNTLALVADHPWLGVGPGGFAATYPAYHRAVVRDEAFSASQQIEEPHNEPLRAAVEWGIPGLVLAALLVTVLLRGVPRRLGRRTAALLGAGAALGLSSLVSLTFVAPPTLLLVTCVAGLLGRVPRGKPSRVPPALARLTTVPLVGLMVWMDVPHWQASRAWRQAEEAARQGSLRSAYEGLRHAAPYTHDAVAYARQAEVARSAGDGNRCAEAAREGLRQAPLSTRLIHLLGECEALRGNTTAAVAAYTQELSLLPESPYALWGLAQLSTGPTRLQLLQQAADAARLEWALLPPALARQEREQLQRLARDLEEELAHATAEE
ncbi:O-antigen ligase family protein [Archangium violaceum]|uniref:O-antigen ligase family protein n=1 Tax=Archangium violaceum TaxID=83451 RepID=UPI002B2EB0F0|nr:O-antigen ligase family protein [Archangium violaceum]